MVLPQQRLLEDEGQRQKLLQYIPCDTTRKEAVAKMQLAVRQAKGDSVWADQWAALQQVCQQVGPDRRTVCHMSTSFHDRDRVQYTKSLAAPSACSTFFISSNT